MESSGPSVRVGLWSALAGVPTVPGVTGRGNHPAAKAVSTSGLAGVLRGMGSGVLAGARAARAVNAGRAALRMRGAPMPAAPVLPLRADRAGRPASSPDKGRA